MHPQYLQIFEGGLDAQLNCLSLDEVILHLDNQLANFLLDEPLAACYINRISADKGLASLPLAAERYAYLLDKYLQLAPFSPVALGALNGVRPDESLEVVRLIVERTSTEPDLLVAIASLDQRADYDQIYAKVVDLFKRNPKCAQAAQQLLSCESALGIVPDSWLEYFKCPAVLRQQWQVQLFCHYAALGYFEAAKTHWDNIKEADLPERALNLAAEMFVAAKDSDRAIEYYRCSLKKDSLQVAVRLRLAELESPFVVRPELVRERKVAIYLYSWNKADILQETLEALAQTDTGNASLTLLLNGCTDHSAQVAAKAVKWFGGR